VTLNLTSNTRLDCIPCLRALKRLKGMEHIDASEGGCQITLGRMAPLDGVCRARRANLYAAYDVGPMRLSQHSAEARPGNRSCAKRRGSHNESTTVGTFSATEHS